MRRLFAAGGVVLLSAALLPPAAAQIPSTARMRFEIAEVHALAEVPARADTAFLATEPAAAFGADTLAVVAKFQAASVPDDVDFAITWVRCGGRSPQPLVAERVDALDLATGAYAMLTNGGAPFAPGAYQVSVTGGGRIFCAVPFTVRASSGAARVAEPPAEAAPPPATYADFAFDGVELSYPSGFGVQPVATGDARGVVLSRAEPFAALFVLARRRGRYDLDRDAAGLLAFLARTVATDGFGAWQRGVVDYDARDLESLNVAGRPARGKAFLTRLGTGPSLDVTLYAAELGGRSAVVGFVALANVHTAEPDPAVDDFYRMVASIRRAGTPAPGLEPRRAPPRAPRSPTDVAAVHRRGGSWYS